MDKCPSLQVSKPSDLDAAGDMYFSGVVLVHEHLPAMTVKYSPMLLNTRTRAVCAVIINPACVTAAECFLAIGVVIARFARGEHRRPSAGRVMRSAGET